MKPSERISKLFSNMHFPSVPGATNAALLEAVIRYLDEQWEANQLSKMNETHTVHPFRAYTDDELNS